MHHVLCMGVYIISFVVFNSCMRYVKSQVCSIVVSCIRYVKSHVRCIVVSCIRYINIHIRCVVVRLVTVIRFSSLFESTFTVYMS
jgi:hypothetical protein